MWIIYLFFLVLILVLLTVALYPINRRGTALSKSRRPIKWIGLGKFAFRQIRKAFVLFVGSCVVLFGIVLIFTPGPAIIVIPLGLIILATEFEWAKLLLKKLKAKLHQTRTRRSKKANITSIKGN